MLAHTLEPQGLEHMHIELHEKVTERGISRWPTDLKAKNLVEQSQRCLANRSMPTKEPCPLRMARIATRRNHCG
jgi:hypothetical protein